MKQWEPCSRSLAAEFKETVKSRFKDQEAANSSLVRHLCGSKHLLSCCSPPSCDFASASIINEFSCRHCNSWMEVYIGRIQACGRFSSSWRPSAQTKMDLLMAAFFSFLLLSKQTPFLCNFVLLSYSFLWTLGWLSCWDAMHTQHLIFA